MTFALCTGAARSVKADRAERGTAPELGRIAAPSRR
jgi:hypothetical protein